MQKLTYIRCGDYYIPDIRLPEENRPIGRWGCMHRDYIKENKPKAINRKKLVAFVLPIIRKEKLPMSEELEKLKHKQYVAERKLTAAKHKEKRLQSELKRLTRSESVDCSFSITLHSGKIESI